MKKEQITTLIIGILIGSILTAGVFMIAKPKNTRPMPQMGEFGNFTRFDGERPNRNGRGRGRRNENGTLLDENNTVGDGLDEKQN